MYYKTRKVHEKTISSISIDDIAACIFEGVEFETPKEKTRLFYSDMSYPRFRTTKYKRVQQKDIALAMPARERVLKVTRHIEAFLNAKGPTQYSEFKIPKRKGGFRTILAPDDEHKEFMREVAYVLNFLPIHPHDSAYAYIKGRDCKSSIKRHQDLKSNWFLKLDLKHFFDSCSVDLFKTQLLKVFPFCFMPRETEQFVEALKKLCFYEDRLPQGTPLSPLLTNWLMIPLDYEIMAALNSIPSNLFVYTRYADDMLISSRTPMWVDETISLINKVLKENDAGVLEINAEKTRYGSKAGRNWNLGIMFNKDNNLTVGYKRKKKIKGMLYRFYEGQRDYEYALQLNGELAYLKNIEPDYFKGLIEYMNSKYHFNFINNIKLAIKNA